MPYLQIQSNLPLTDDQQQSLLSTAREITARKLGKSEAFCMVSFSPQSQMLFGESQEPAVFANLKSLGVDKNQADALTKSLGSLLRDQYSLPPERFYLCCESISRGLWGWNDKVF